MYGIEHCGYSLPGFIRQFHAYPADVPDAHHDKFDMRDIALQVHGVNHFPYANFVCAHKYGVIDAKDFAPTIRGSMLESVGDGLYRILDDGLGYVRNADNTPYVLDLNPVQVNSK